MFRMCFVFSDWISNTTCSCAMTPFFNVIMRPSCVFSEFGVPPCACRFTPATKIVTNEFAFSEHNTLKLQLAVFYHDISTDKKYNVKIENGFLLLLQNIRQTYRSFQFDLKKHQRKKLGSFAVRL